MMMLSMMSPKSAFSRSREPKQKKSEDPKGKFSK
jgi:hypothetical protein